MNIEQFNEMLLESARVGLALVKQDDLRIVFHNARFEEWFPDVAEEGVTVDQLFDIDVDRLRKRTGRGRPYTRETETKVGRRSAGLVRVSRKRTTASATWAGSSAPLADQRL